MADSCESRTGNPCRTTVGVMTIRPGCPTTCDRDCDADCHEGHYVRWKRQHQPEDCPSATSGGEAR